MILYGVSLGEGNTKVGEVMTFSLPSKITCPGASVWCLKRCYARRYEVRRPGCVRAYRRNLALARDIAEFKRVMIGVLPRIMPCFRIHISGDFFSAEYVEAWREICESFPDTRFWSYTRSWAVPELIEALERLRESPNVELFASTDPGMPLPPQGWRVAFVKSDLRANGLLCSSQTGIEESCLTCGHCFTRGRGNVVFKVH